MHPQMWIVPAALAGVRRVCAVRAATCRREGWEEKPSGVSAEQQTAPRDREPAGGSGAGAQAAAEVAGPAQCPAEPGCAPAALAAPEAPKAANPGPHVPSATPALLSPPPL